VTVVVKSALLIGVVWLAAAVFVSQSGLLSRGARTPQLVLVALTVVLAVSLAFIRGLREFAWKVNVRALVLLHVTRFAGFYFLTLYGQNRLPYDFAVKGGIGDITVAFLALAAAAVPARSAIRRWMLLGWNTLGLLDILFVVATAARLAGAEPGSMDELRHLPLSLLPTFLVPVIIVSHGIIGLRALKNEIG